MRTRWTNGGSSCFNPLLIPFLGGPRTLEEARRCGEPLAHRHTGFWLPVDLRENNLLKSLSAKPGAPELRRDLLGAEITDKLRMSEHEFDRFASDYETTLRRHTRFGDRDPSYFASYKVKAVRDSVGPIDPRARILDFGCGVGQSTRFFSEMFPRALLFGADVSCNSVEIARKTHGTLANYTCFRSGEPLPYDDNSIDLAFTSCVLHHIPDADHERVLFDIRRILKPGGFLFVFEHNPLNPLTVRIVNNCPFDRNAVLIKSGVMRDKMAAAGYGDIKIRYCLFVPGWLRWLGAVESLLTWCPLGAQYYAVGRKGRIS
jgi:SAM-dependent methyltransferase